MNCKYCARTIPDDAVVCCYCGKPVLNVTRWRCPHCGREFEGDRIYCDQCGMGLVRITEKESPCEIGQRVAGTVRRKEAPTAFCKCGIKHGWLIGGIAAAVCCAILLFLVLWMAGIINW